MKRAGTGRADTDRASDRAFDRTSDRAFDRTSDRTSSPGPVPLSRQDLALLAMVAAGHQVDLIARRLDVSERTVRRRIRQVCDRIEVSSAVEAVVWAVRKGLI